MCGIVVEQGAQKKTMQSREEVVRDCQRSHVREIPNDEDERGLRTGKVRKMGGCNEELSKWSEERDESMGKRKGSAIGL